MMPLMGKNLFLRLINLLAFGLTVLINSLAGSTKVIGGRLTAEISDAYPTYVTPAGYTFSIWGIIYTLLGVFVIYQLVSRSESDFREKIGWFFALSCILNITWIFAWQYEQLVISVLLIFFLLLTLIIIYLRLEIGKSSAPLREKLAVHLPFSVYLGWITIASIANASVTLVSMKWDGFGISPINWAILIIIIASLITMLVVISRKDLGYGLVVVWALVGIGVKQSGTPIIVTTVEVASVLVIVVLALSIVVSRIKQRF